MQIAPEDISERVAKHLFTAIGNLSQLCTMYDNGAFSLAPLMTTLIHQLVIRTPSNVPLFDQVGWDRASFPVMVRSGLLGEEAARRTAVAHLFIGATRDMQPMSRWFCDFQAPRDAVDFQRTTIKDWLEAPVAAGSSKLLSRFDVIKTIRNKDGGSHFDTDQRMEKEIDYLELLNWLPVDRRSVIEIDSVKFSVSAHLPPVTYPIVRQCAFELLSAIYSFTDMSERLLPATIVAIFGASDLLYVVAPDGYPKSDSVYGQTPLVGDAPEYPTPVNIDN